MHGLDDLIPVLVHGQGLALLFDGAAVAHAEGGRLAQGFGLPLGHFHHPQAHTPQLLRQVPLPGLRQGVLPGPRQVLHAQQRACAPEGRTVSALMHAFLFDLVVRSAEQCLCMLQSSLVHAVAGVEAITIA